MNELNINNLEILEQYSNPFPLIIYSNFLDINQLDSLKKDLNSDNAIFDKTVMGNRKTILKGTSNFDNFIRQSKIGLEIDSFFENKSVFKFFYENLSDLNKKNSDNFDFRNKNFKFLKNFTKNAGSATNRSTKFKFKNRVSKIFSQIFQECRIYCDFDFSVASTGYWREPHHDKDERILNFLLYVNDFDGNNGGNFQIFKYKKLPNNYIKQPNLDDLEMVKKIQPQKGYLVTFLSSPNSLHGVDIIKKTEQKRYFFYGSYTSLQRIDWKKKI